jgi:transcriptional regulator GlxA family with amidase domain
MTTFILIVENAYATSVAQTLDMLSAATLLAARQGRKLPQWRVCGARAGLLRLSNGLTLNVTALPKRITSDDHCVLPGLGIDSPVRALQSLEQAEVQKISRWLVRATAAGSPIYASCSAALLLAKAGLLAGKTVTTSWWLGQTLKAVEPQAIVDVSRMVIDDTNIITAGAAMAHADLMLWFIKRNYGIELADTVSRFVLATQRVSQSAFVMPAAYTTGDELIRRISQRLQAALPTALSMKTLAAEFNMTQRTLARRVVSATGQSPLSLLQSIRIHEAQRLLETSRLSVEEIAIRVGYRDGTALRRLLQLACHVTPSQMRSGSK